PGSANRYRNNVLSLDNLWQFYLDARLQVCVAIVVDRSLWKPVVERSQVASHHIVIELREHVGLTREVTPHLRISVESSTHLGVILDPAEPFRRHRTHDVHPRWDHSLVRLEAVVDRA